MNGIRDAVVIGGGFFGLYVAEYLRGRFDDVLLCDKETDVMTRASYVNQARVHNGYHYPRSILTARRSHANFPRFAREFPECIDSSFENVYAIGKSFSKVSAEQFRLFMTRIGAPIEVAPPRLRRLFDPLAVEEVFRVVEYAFDAVVLRRLMVERVKAAGVEKRLATRVVRIRRDNAGLAVELLSDAREETVRCRRVFNCTYSEINRVLHDSGLPLIRLKHELTEMALVEVVEPLRHVGVTMMCGPFFSTLPFPALRLHTLSHVRYTPHFHWYDTTGAYRDAHEVLERAEKPTAFPHMIRDVRRYLPLLGSSIYRGSLWEVKTVLPLSEIDDSRPILFKKHYGLPGLHVIMGGKIDNIYDVAEELDRLLVDDGA